MNESKLTKAGQRTIILLSAILYGIIEGFIFTHGAHFGPPDFFNHTFISGYHLPMAALMMLICFGYNNWQMFPAWILVEDITYWLTSGQLLDSSSWVAMSLGGIHFTPQAFLPFTYLLLMMLWYFLELLSGKVRPFWKL
jgi:hypothetical protein